MSCLRYSGEAWRFPGGSTAARGRLAAACRLGVDGAPASPTSTSVGRSVDRAEATPALLDAPVPNSSAHAAIQRRSRRAAGPAPRTRSPNRGRRPARSCRRRAPPARASVVKCVTKSSSAGDLALPRARRCDHRSSESDERERKLGARVRVGDRATHRAAVPGHEVPDSGSALREQSGRGRARACESSAACRASAPIRTLPFSGSSRVEARDAVQVDEHRRSREPHVQQRDEALAAGEQLRVGPALLEQQRAPPRRSSRRTYSNGAGFTGSAPRRGPGSAAPRRLDARARRRRRSRSPTGALIVFPSPSPFAPSGVNGDGVSRWPIRSGGRSGARRAEVVHEGAREQVAVLVVDDAARRVPRRRRARSRRGPAPRRAAGSAAAPHRERSCSRAPRPRPSRVDLDDGDVDDEAVRGR